MMHQPELTTTSSVDHAAPTPVLPVTYLTYNIGCQYCGCQVKKGHKCPKCGKQNYVNHHPTDTLCRTTC